MHTNTNIYTHLCIFFCIPKTDFEQARLGLFAVYVFIPNVKHEQYCAILYSIRQITVLGTQRNHVYVCVHMYLIEFISSFPVPSLCNHMK